MSTWRAATAALAAACALALPAAASAQPDYFEQGSTSVQFNAGYVQKLNWGPGVPEFQLLPLNARLGCMLNSPVDHGPLFSANWEGLFELAADPALSSFAHMVAGPSVMLRRNATGLCAGVVPYMELGAGLIYTDGAQDMTQRAVGQACEFYLQAGVGLRWLFDSPWSLETGVEFLHISNGGVADRNGGLNCLGFSVGATYHFGARCPSE